MLLVFLPQPASATTLSDVNIRLNDPVASYTPDVSPEISSSAVQHWSVTWKENSPGFNATVKSSDEFKAGLAYKVEIWMMVYTGDYFDTDIYGQLAANITVNGKPATSVSVEGRDSQGLITQVLVTYEYGPLPGMVISNVLVKGIPTPVEGQMPIYSFTVGSNAYGYYHTAPVVWWDMTTGEEMDSSDTFIKGHKYQVNIWLQANRSGGFTFKTNSNGDPQVNVTLNSWAADSVTKAYEQEGREVIDIRYTFPACQAAHTCTPTLVPQQDPTCLLPGFRAYYECSCGKCFEDAAGKKEITDMDGYGILAAHGHIEGEWSYNGTHHYKKCTVCMEVIPGTNAAHSGGTAVCTQKAKCSACGYSYGSVANEHKWSPTYLYKDSNGHAWVCADCKTHSDVEAHTPGPAATETKPQTCKDCGYIIEPAKNHTHTLTKVAQVPATCTQGGNIEYYTCSGCSEHFTDAAGKNKLPADKRVEVGALGHTPSNFWRFDREYHWRICTTCQAVLDETKMLHEAADGKCTTCGYVIGSDSVTETTAMNPSEPTDSGKETVPSTEPVSSGDAPNNQTPVDQKKNTSWVLAVMIGLVCFGASITATVIILKRKRK